MKENIIDILYALKDRNGNYSKLVGTSICSLLENTNSRIRIHVFHDGSVCGKNRECLEQLVEVYQQRIKFYNVRELLVDVWEEAERILPKAISDSRFTEATLYRLLAPQILSNIERLIYLDADTVVNIDIIKLWQERIGPSGLAAVREADVIKHFELKRLDSPFQQTVEDMSAGGVNIDNCFNAGVLLMNLHILRKRGNLLLDGFRMLTGISDETNFYDQNILNYYFAKDLTPLPSRYNLLQYWDKKNGNTKTIEGIYHYSGHSLTLNPKDERDTMYWNYFLKTPWADGEFFCRFFSEFRKLYQLTGSTTFKKIRAVLSAIGGKTLVVVYADGFGSSVHKLFNENTIYCQAGQGNSLQLRFEYDVETHFYLLFLPDYPKIKVMLEKAGLVEGEHFLDGDMFLENRKLVDDLYTIQEIFEGM
ncbi:glycosyltransferase [Selenomonas sp. AB3002]|uniref:glycosyltransferase family 8 protein n=1 Tax=Selenomonas sp. AB3002 TaxID=1392502 RepID=UPI000497B790